MPRITIDVSVRVQFSPALEQALLAFLRGGAGPSRARPPSPIPAGQREIIGAPVKRPRGRPRKTAPLPVRTGLSDGRPVTLDDVRAAYFELARADGGALALAAILRRFGITGVTEARGDQLHALYLALSGALPRPS